VLPVISLGKRPLVRRRGRGGKQFRAITVGKIAPAKYPNFKLDEHHSGLVVDIVHERGRDAPLTKIRFDNGVYSYVPAPQGIAVGEKIELGVGATATARNILSLEAIPDGTLICNIGKNTVNGDKLSLQDLLPSFLLRCNNKVSIWQVSYN